MHSDLTLDIMNDVTASLGKAFRNFNATVCPVYSTRELPRESAARRRRQNPKSTEPTGKAKAFDGESRKKCFNLQTYKYHSLDDYVETIRQLGTTDSFSTAIVSVI
jgi:hypothetical protein